MPELTRSEAETPVRYHGPTRLGQQPRSRPQMWALAAFGGVAGPFAVIAFLAPWISLVIAGEHLVGDVLNGVLVAGIEVPEDGWIIGEAAVLFVGAAHDAHAISNEVGDVDDVSRGECCGVPGVIK